MADGDGLLYCDVFTDTCYITVIANVTTENSRLVHMGRIGENQIYKSVLLLRFGIIPGRVRNDLMEVK